MQRPGWGLLLGLLCWLWSGEGEAQSAEQRCDELGVNCVCHRSMEAASWVPAGPPDFFRESNQVLSDSKLCGWENSSTGALLWHAASGSLSVITGLNNRPATRDTMQGGTSQVYLSDAQNATLTSHVATRYYVRLGSGYVSTNVNVGGTCGNDKYTQIGDYLTAYNTGFVFGSNGAAMSPNVTPSQMVGKWWRIEHHLNNYNAPTTHTVYMKNITDNGAEIVTSFPAGVNTTDRASLLANTKVIHRYREGSGCVGSFDVAYAMMAHWPTNAGQRIGAAYELEGGAPGDTTPPAPVTNLRVTWVDRLWEWLLGSASWLVATLDALLGVPDAAAQTASAEQLTVTWDPRPGQHFSLVGTSFAWPTPKDLGTVDAALGRTIIDLRPYALPAGQPGDDRWICVSERNGLALQGCNQLKLGSVITLPPPTPSPSPTPTPTIDQRLAAIQASTAEFSDRLASDEAALAALATRLGTVDAEQNLDAEKLAAIKQAVCALKTASTVRDALRKALGGC